MDIAFGILELLASKICHDLVSPVGAINNGIELIEDVGGGMAAEAMKLIASSANLANQRLKLFRVAYGRGGSDPGLRLEDARAILLASLPGGKITVDWPPAIWPEHWRELRGAIKLALNVILLAEESLPHGGKIALAVPNGTELAIMAHGRGAHFLAESRAALGAHGMDPQAPGPVVDASAITPRTVQAYYTNRLACHYGFAVKMPTAEAETADSVVFRIVSA